VPAGLTSRGEVQGGKRIFEPAGVVVYQEGGWRRGQGRSTKVRTQPKKGKLGSIEGGRKAEKENKKKAERRIRGIDGRKGKGHS